MFLLIYDFVKITAHSFVKYILIPHIFVNRRLWYILYFIPEHVALVKLHVFGYLNIPQLPNFANCTHSIVSYQVSQNWFHSEFYSTEGIKFITPRLHLWQLLKQYFKTWEKYQLNQADIMTLSAEYQWWVLCWFIGLSLHVLYWLQRSQSKERSE